MRLFFAYWPSAEKAKEIAVWVDRAQALYGGRKMKTETLHMTLAFLGEATEEQARELTAACREWQLPSGAMVLQEVGRFHRAKVLWLGPVADDREPDTLVWLHEAHQRLWSYLAPYGWRRRETEFRPHVSLLRNAGPGELDALTGPPVEWAPGRCALVASRPTEVASHYSVLAEVPVAASKSEQASGQ